MNLGKQIIQKIPILTEQEGDIVQWIIEHLDFITIGTLKGLATQLAISERKLTRLFQKLEFSGFKDFQQQLRIEQKSSSQKTQAIFKQRWALDLLNFDQVFRGVNYVQLDQLADKIAIEQKPILIFTTNRTKNLGEKLYQKLLAYHLQVEIYYSSIYDEQAFQVANKLVIFFTLRGKNSLVKKYLEEIKKPNNVGLEIAVLSSTAQYEHQKQVNYFFYGIINRLPSDDESFNLFVEQYPVWRILDWLLMRIDLRISNI